MMCVFLSLICEKGRFERKSIQISILFTKKKKKKTKKKKKKESIFRSWDLYSIDLFALRVLDAILLLKM